MLNAVSYKICFIHLFNYSRFHERIYICFNTSIHRYIRYSIESEWNNEEFNDFNVNLCINDLNNIWFYRGLIIPFS